MSKRLPSLDVFRSVENISQDDIQRIRQDVAARNPSFSDGKKIRKLFETGVKLPLRAYVINRRELMRLQRVAIPEQAVDGDHIRELWSYIGSHMSNFTEESVTAPTLPARTFEEGDRKTRLSIGSSLEITQERFLAKQAICDFYSIDTADAAPAWSDDEVVTMPILLRGNKAFGRDVLHQIHDVLQAGVGLLPNTIELGPIDKHFS